jgi:hypothetical protein
MKNRPQISYHEYEGKPTWTIWKGGHKPITYEKARVHWDKVGSAVWSIPAHMAMTKIVMAENILPPTKRYIAVIPNAWGKGDSQFEAIRVAKSEGGSKPRWVVIYEFPAEHNDRVYVDDMGMLYGPTPEEGMKKIKDTRKS